VIVCKSSNNWRRTTTTLWLLARPTFAIRSYLPAGHPDKAKEIGSETTPEAFIATMVAVFREVRRVLHPSGVLFLNLGDGYNQNNAGQLLNIPHRVAEALRADGWIWRQTIVWAKSSPMPESLHGWRWVKCRVKVTAARTPRRDGHHSEGFDEIRHLPVTQHPQSTWQPCPGCEKCSDNDGWVLQRGKGRCTTSHEYLFLFSKSQGYFWDSSAFTERTTGGAHHRGHGATPKSAHGVAGVERYNTGFSAAVTDLVTTRNPRSVWTINAEPSKEKHFAAYPTELVRRCVQAGTSDAGCCSVCGMPWAPMVTSERVATRPGNESKTYLVQPLDPDSPYQAHGGTICGNRDPKRHCTETHTHGYRPTCTCNAPATPCRCLDPFAGTGTTLQVASWMGRDAVGIELNLEYVGIAQRRVNLKPRCLQNGSEVTRKEADGQRMLF